MKFPPFLRKLLLYGLILLAMFLAGVVYYSLKYTGEKADYSSYSAGPKGVKALYLLTEQMGFEVSRYKKSSRFLPPDTTLIALNPDPDLFNDGIELKYLRAWLEKGNSMVLIGDADQSGEYKIINSPQTKQETAGSGEDYLAYSIGQGKLYFLGGEDAYTNAELEAVKPAVLFIDILQQVSHERVYFNEYYHGTAEEGLVLFDILGPTANILLLQILLALIIFLSILAGRFGKPVTVFETQKRIENENLFALSSIYIKSRANGAVLETHLKGFRKELGKYLGFMDIPEDGVLATAALENRYLRDKGIDELLRACNEYLLHRQKDTGLLVRLVNRMEEIRKGIR